jgi:hypothetical protein
MNRSMSRAAAVGFLAFGVALVAPATGWAQRPTDQYPKDSVVTVVGCFQQDTKHHSRYVLAKPTVGTAVSVKDSSCSSDFSEMSFEVAELKESHLKDSMPLNQWIEVTGRLGKIRDGDDLRVLHADSFRVVPIAQPPIARAPEPAPYIPPAPMIETPAPAPEVAVIETPAPVATTGRKLPHTASPLGLIGLIGFTAFAGALVLGLFDRRRNLGRA